MTAEGPPVESAVGDGQSSVKLTGDGSNGGSSSPARRTRGLFSAQPGREIDDYHYIFSADCKPYMDWQAVALYASWQTAGSPGRFTRLLSCEDANYKYYDVVPTHVCPRYDNLDPGDVYSAYNLPGSILHWTTHNMTDRKWVIKLDADMIIRKPLSVHKSKMEARPGLVAAGEYGYLVGVQNEMAHMFVPDDVVPILAKVGGWEIFWAEDLRKAAPLWLEYTKKVRQDPRAHYPFKGSGDAYITAENPRPWISEMYGYVFGTAMAGLRHNVQGSVQLYAGMPPWDAESFDPFLIHYGLRIDIETWNWDKHFEFTSKQPDKFNCRERFVPFPMVPEALLPDRRRAPSHGGAEGRRREIVAELMGAINRGVYAYRARVCGEPWPAGFDAMGLDKKEEEPRRAAVGSVAEDGDIDAMTWEDVKMRDDGNKPHLEGMEAAGMNGAAVLRGGGVDGDGGGRGRGGGGGSGVGTHPRRHKGRGKHKRKKRQREEMRRAWISAILLWGILVGGVGYTIFCQGGSGGGRRKQTRR